MQLVMLSGNSLRNRDWIYTAKQQFADLFDDFYIQDYQHWETKSEWIDLPHELKVLRERSVGFESDYGVFAKSIGTVLTVQAIEQRILRPRWLLLCGLPLNYITESYPLFAEVLAASKLPVVVVHNVHDPVGEAVAVKAFLGNAFADRDNYQFIKTSGATHDYENYALLRKQLAGLRG